MLLWGSRHCPGSWIDRVIVRTSAASRSSQSSAGNGHVTSDSSGGWQRWVPAVAGGQGWVSGDQGGAGGGWWSTGEKEREFPGLGSGLALALHFLYAYPTSWALLLFLKSSSGHSNLTVPIFLYDPCPQNQIPHFFHPKGSHLWRQP